MATPVTIESGNSKFWNFTWADIAEGSYRFTATVTAPGGNNTADRNTTVLFRETVENDDTDADDDDDGLLDSYENTAQELPEVTSDQWTNGDVHSYYAYGKSSPRSPDSDGDGLPDSLELGWRTADDPPTDLSADTDGDGFTNFIGDLDPPFYNTVDNYGNVPDVDSISLGGNRTRLSAGSVTDPTNPDSDSDGIPDGIEDGNRNGWVDGDGASIPIDFNPWAERDWPDGIIGQSETWIETDPNNRDTDDDNASDGYGEDKNFDGLIAGDSNTNRTYDTGEAWSETDPLSADTDADGLPDGWEINYGLDPLDDGTDSMRTSVGSDGNTINGATGNPDGDSFNNLQELINGTNPNSDDDVPPSPPNSIIIGPGSSATVGNAANLNEFTDWTIDDLLVLDEYDGNGNNNQGSDIYLAYDGFDSSRDITAFYFRDGGSDGNLYFRFDFHDLQAFAEEGNLDCYVVIDSGNPEVGESALPDEVDTRTEMKWEMVVAIYQTDNGAVYLDTDPTSNTTEIGADLTTKGVISRSQNDANGFGRAYYNSELDALEVSTSRQALIDAGWNGDPDSLNFQVYTTRDGTENSGAGLGDIGGRSDIRDAVYDDSIASSYFRDQSNISGSKSILYSWFGRNGSNDRGKRAKVAFLSHGNQPIRSSNEMHDRVNDGAGAGYFRLIDAHEAYTVPLNLHITPTLASALQWAKVDPAANKPWRDGPSLNTRISTLLLSDEAILLGTSFADQAIPYATDAFTQDSVNLANEILSEIYSASPSSTIFWPAERIAGDTVLETIKNMGYTHTLVDQMRHFFKWFGRTEALSESGYRLNQVNGITLLPIHDAASSFLYQNQDNGLNFPLRELLNRRARSNTQDQILNILSDWEEFRTTANANAYDRNLRWMINRPWIDLVKLDDITDGNVDLSEPADGTGDPWGLVDRGTGQSLPQTAKDYIDHATQENYNNWYAGQNSREEGLEPKVFNIRTSVPLPEKFGTVGVDGLAQETWQKVGSISASGSGQEKLARSTMHAAMFVTAFHNQQNNDRSKFSTGKYVYPDTDYNTLADFSKFAQSQMRFASLYKRVDSWAASPPTGATASAEDIDLDNENEYLLYNASSFAVFEAIGGRCIAAFTRNPSSGAVYQIIGTQPTYPEGETEEEGILNVNSGNIEARRTSAFKDWYADGSAGVSSQYVNALYTVSAHGTNGWIFTSPDGHIIKRITLSESAPQLQANYSLPNPQVTKLYIRNGLSPNLWNLIARGQYDLDTLNHDANLKQLSLVNRGGNEAVTALLAYDTSVNYVSSAVDDDPAGGTEWDAVNMRNQALTEQVELTNTDGQSSFTIQLALENGKTDNDADGLPNWWERDSSLNPDIGTGNDGASGNTDGDPFNNFEEYVLGLDPTVVEFNGLTQGLVAPDGNGGFNITFQTLSGRNYQIWYSDDLNGPWNQASSIFSATSDSEAYIWNDDGSQTSPSPSTVNRRFYKIEISRP